MKRPFGVTSLAILAIVAGIAQMLVSFAAFARLGLFGAASAAAVAGTVAIPQSEALALVLAAFLFVLSCLDIVFAIGAFRLRPWAWGLGVALAILSVLNAGATAVAAGRLTAGDTFTVIIAVLVLVYLSNPHVKKAFGRG